MSSNNGAKSGEFLWEFPWEFSMGIPMGIPMGIAMGIPMGILVGIAHTITINKASQAQLVAMQVRSHIHVDPYGSIWVRRTSVWIRMAPTDIRVDPYLSIWVRRIFVHIRMDPSGSDGPPQYYGSYRHQESTTYKLVFVSLG